MEIPSKQLEVYILNSRERFQAKDTRLGELRL